MYAAEDYERCFVRAVAEAVEKSAELNHSAFAHAVRALLPSFASTSAGAVTKWRRIRTVSKGKPQNLTLCEAHVMAQVLGKDFAKLACTAQQIAKSA